ncbi:TPA: hypothetical protein ACI0S1_000539 [Streptococcus agalactiae]
MTVVEKVDIDWHAFDSVSLASKEKEYDKPIFSCVFDHISNSSA